jgi:hypothetical protein
MFLSYNPKFYGAEVNVENEIFNPKQTKTKFAKLLAKCNLKNMADIGLTAEVEHREYFFSNHLRKTLVDTHKVEYIYIIENMNVK